MFWLWLVWKNNQIPVKTCLKSTKTSSSPTKTGLMLYRSKGRKLYKVSIVTMTSWRDRTIQVIIKALCNDRSVLVSVWAQTLWRGADNVLVWRAPMSRGSNGGIVLLSRDKCFSFICVRSVSQPGASRLHK